MSEVKRWRMSDMPLSEYGLYTEVVLASEYDRVEKERDELRAFQELGMATRLGMYADVLKENARLRETLKKAGQYLQEGKAKFAPTTTNSLVDGLISDIEKLL